MKRKLLPFLLIACFLSLAGTINSRAQGTATTNIYYGGFQACGGCTVCGADYWCINTLGSYCGDTPPCDTKTFWDPVPAGNIVTNIQLNMWIGECQGSTIDASVNSNVFPQALDGNTGCLCSNLPCGQTTSTTATYPCGISDYNYGSSAPNTLQLCTGAGVCMQRIEIVCTYAPADQSTPPTGTGTVTGNTFVCAGSSEVYTLVGGPFTGVATYNWTVPAGWSITSGQGTTSITVTSASSSGQVCCTPTNLCGTDGPFCLAVTGSALPLDPTATVDNSNFCTGSVSNITLTSVGGSGTTLNWYSGACGGTFIGSGVNLTIPAPATTTTYYNSWTASCGTSGCGSVTVNVNPLPAAEAGVSPGTITCATTQLTLSGSGGTGYSWSASGGGNIVSGGNTANPVVNAGGTYTVTVTDANGCTGTDNVVISQSNSVPVADAGISPGIINCTTPSLTLAGSGGGNYSWSASGGGNIVSGANTANPVINAGGTYTVTVTDVSSGCTSTDDVIISQDLSVPVADAGTSPGIINCTVTNLTLSGSGGGNYSWSATGGGNIVSGVNTANPVVNAGGTYTVTVTNPSSGCTSTDDVIVAEDITPPVANAGADVNVCQGTSTQLNASGGTSYSWSPTSTLDNPFISNPNATPTSTTTYTVTVTNAANGCTASDDVVVGFSPPLNPVIITSGQVGFCDSASVNVTLDAGSGYSSYFWSTNEVTQAIIVTQPGTYTVTVTDAIGCTGSSSGITVYVQPPILDPVIIAAGPSTFCKGDSVNLYLVDPFYTYVWSSGSTTPSIWAFQTGDYVVTVTDSLGCEYITDPYHIQVNPLPSAFASFSNMMLDVDFFDFSAYSTSWDWDFGDGQFSALTNPVHTYDSSGIYTVVLTVSNNCGSDSDTLIIDLPGYAGVDENGDLSNLLIYPVPVYQNVIVSFYLANASDFIISVTDVLGQTIYSEDVSDFNGLYLKSIDLSNCARGIYLLNLKSNDFITVRKFSKE